MAKPDLLLLHGALGCKAQFHALASLLQPYYNIHTLNFSGHGDAPLPAGRDFSMQLFADDVLQYLEDHGLEEVDIFGYSMGGYVALYLCGIASERIKRVFTLGTKINWTHEYAGRECKKLDAEVIKAKVPAFAEELERRHTATGWQHVLGHTAEMMMGLGDNNLLKEELLKGIQQLVRLGQGDRDNTLTLEETLSNYRLLPAGQLEIFPATPHPFEKVPLEMLSASIRNFFV